MVNTDNSLQQFAHQRYKLFQEQNFKNGRFDVTFQFGKNKKLYAHSFVLWPLSKVFENILYGPMAEKGSITSERYEFEDFKEFLTYLYIGKCKIDAKNVMKLVDASEFYDIKPLKDECDAFITQNATETENVLKLYESLKLYTLKSAMAKVMETISSKTDEILKSNDFLSIEKETVLDIVKMDKLTSKEEDLFQAVLKWATVRYGNEEGKIKTEIADILPFIRFPIMSLEFLHNFVVSKGYIFSSFEELSKVLRDATAFAQNGSSAQKCSKYSNKFRGGLRVQFFDYQNCKAYANIQDPKVVEAMKAVWKSSDEHNQVKGLPVRCMQNIQVPETLYKINSPTPNAKYYLIREKSMGRVSVQQYQQNNPNYFYYDHDIIQNDDLWFFKQYDVIAPLISENDNFNGIYSEITFKLV